MDRAPQWMRWLAQERPGEDLWPWMKQEQPREMFAGTSTVVTLHPQPRAKARPMTFEQWADSLVPRSTGVVQQAVDTLSPEEDTYQEDQEGSKGKGKGRKKRGKKKRGPLKESAGTQAEEEGVELQWQLEENHKQDMEWWRSALAYQYQEDLLQVERDLSDRYTSEIEELKENYEVRLGGLLMAEDECHEYREAWEAQQQSISIQREDIELLKKENASLREIGVQAEVHFKKELERVKRELLQKHADELARARQKVQELEQAHQVETAEGKSRWEDFKRKSEEELSLVCKELEDKVELEKSLVEQQNTVQLLEAQVRQLEEQSQEDLAATVSSFKAALGDKEQEVEQLAGQVRSLQAKLEETTQQQKSEMVASEEKIKRLVSEKEQVQLELATEKASKAALGVQLQKISSELRAEISGLQEEVVRAHKLVGKKEQELEELRLRNVSCNEELRDLKKTVSKLKGELASMEAMKERAAKMESELQGFLEVARTREIEMDNIQSAIHSKDLSLKRLEGEKRPLEQESISSQKLHEGKLQECEVLSGQVKKPEQQCKEQDHTITRLEKSGAASEQQQQVETDALKREVVQQKKLVAELEKFLETSKSTQDNAIEKLKREILNRGRELTQSRKDTQGTEQEFASRYALVWEKGKPEESGRYQMSRCLQESERKTSFIRSLEQEMSRMYQQLEEKEAEGKDLRRLVLAELVKNKGLEERLQLLQSKGSTAVSRAAERCLAMRTENKNCHELTTVEYKRGLFHSCMGFPSEQGESDSSASEEAAVPLLLGGVCHGARPPERLDPGVSTHQDLGQQGWPDYGHICPLGLFVGWSGRGLAWLGCEA